jgi:crossover junction endodeoxyribonuclease RuvC
MIIGIDPGSISAAYAVLGMNSCGLQEVGDVPVADRMVDASAFSRIVKQWNPEVAVIEQVAAMPKQGVSSSFRFGMGCGLLRGVIQTLGIPLIQVPATRWKRHFNLNAEAEKSRALAIRYWPECDKLAFKKDHGRAEAMLIARWFAETQR